MKFNSKIKKGSIAVYVLALMLVTAGYWNFLSQETQTLETVATENTEENLQTENTGDDTLGDATLVSNNELIKEESSQNQSSETESQTAIEPEQKLSKEDEYFEESKLARDTMYSQTLETYQNMLNNTNVTEEQKAVVTQEITNLNKEKNSIMICENLISTKGFENCVIFVNRESISVIVKAETLETDKIAQIQNIISREMNANIDNIHIMTK